MRFLLSAAVSYCSTTLMPERGDVIPFVWAFADIGMSLKVVGFPTVVNHWSATRGDFPRQVQRALLDH
jgi:hypothetical protein